MTVASDSAEEEQSSCSAIGKEVQDQNGSSIGARSCAPMDLERGVVTLRIVV